MTLKIAQLQHDEPQKMEAPSQECESQKSSYLVVPVIPPFGRVCKILLPQRLHPRLVPTATATCRHGLKDEATKENVFLQQETKLLKAARLTPPANSGIAIAGHHTAQSAVNNVQQ